MIGLASSPALRHEGILGINQRNADYVMRYNPRHLYPLVDDKLRTKQLAQAAAIPVPELYALVEIQRQVRDVVMHLQSRPGFVVKPAHGAGGNGVLVIDSPGPGGRWRKANGSLMDVHGLQHHIHSILSGMFSLGGVPDQALVEYKVGFDPLFDSIAYQGVPDIRVVVFRGVPAAAMVRLPTRQSDGKANLHQGAIGVGINLLTGITEQGVYRNCLVNQHPDTYAPTAGVQLPDWNNILLMAARCADLVGLGYLGVDIVLDKDRGPMILELNARPGLNVQLATGRGLKQVLDKLEAERRIPATAAARVEFAKTLLA